MNEAELTKLEVRLRKAYRSAFFCGVLAVMAMMTTVMLPLIAGQPVDQKAVAEGWTPLLILLAAIAGLCHMFHAGVKSKLKMLKP